MKGINLVTLKREVEEEVEEGVEAAEEEEDESPDGRFLWPEDEEDEEDGADILKGTVEGEGNEWGDH